MTDTSRTVESCLAELREMFPRRKLFKVEHRTYSYQDGRVKESSMIVISTYSKYFYGRTLNDCMAQVRAWKESQLQIELEKL